MVYNGTESRPYFVIPFIRLFSFVYAFITESEYVEGEKAQLTEQELQKLRKPVRLGEGSMAEAGAIRLAIARALCSFVSEQETETMRLGM